ncbi:MAG: PEGA domain-containing protein [Polyangiales bacterium]
MCRQGLSIVCWLGLAWCLAGAGTALAQHTPPNGSNQAAYRDQISKALQEYTLGHWAEARVYFAEAHAIWPNARTFRGLGMTCYEARSYVESIDFLEQALRNTIQPLTPKLAEEARRILDQAKRFVSSVKLELDPSDATLTIDDKPLRPRADGDVLVNPGEHQLDISAPGYQDLHRIVVAEAGQPLRVHATLRSLADDDEAEETHAPAPDRAISLASPGGDASAIEDAAPSEPQLTLANQLPVVAAVIGGIGLGGIATGWVFYKLRDHERLTLWQQGLGAPGQTFIDFDQGALQRYRLRGVIAMASAGGGSLLLGLAQYFWLPDSPDVPVWAWVVGAAGAALGLTALAFGIFMPHCEVADARGLCQRTASDPLFAPLLGAHALPFLTLPLMYLLRARLPVEQAQVSLWVPPSSAGRPTDGLGLRVSGSF